MVVRMLTGWHMRASTMKRLAFILALLILLFGCGPNLKPTTWTYNESKDGMTGDVSSYIITHSNSLPNNKGQLLLGYMCNSLLYLRVNFDRFVIEHHNCGTEDCEQIQNVRIKFDDARPKTYKFDIDDSSHSSMTLTSNLDMYRAKPMTTRHSLADIARDAEIGSQNLNAMLDRIADQVKLNSELINGMKNGARMFVEVKLSNHATQIAEFDLSTFTTALNQCSK
jgi:hypothetical protein